jgi:hypothetical protein
MRFVLAKGILIFLIILVTGSGLTLAAASSEPGMFLYPIKQTTQRLAGALGGTYATQAPIISTTQDGLERPPLSGNDGPGQDGANEGAVQAPVSPETPGTGEATTPSADEGHERGTQASTPAPHADQATATRVPTRARTADEITAAVQAGGGVLNIAGNSPEGIQPGNQDENQSQPSPDSSQDNQSPDNPHGDESPDHDQPDSNPDDDRSHDEGQSDPSQDSGDDQQREHPEDK